MESTTPDPRFTFPAVGHRSPLTSNSLYCYVTESHVCEQLAHGRCLQATWLRDEAKASAQVSPYTIPATRQSRRVGKNGGLLAMSVKKSSKISRGSRVVWRHV